VSYRHDENGIYKTLADGRVLRVTPQLYNTIVTVSRSAQEPGWEDGW
jgi:hypothetical protein